MASDIEIFIGTHEDFLLSFKIKNTEDDNLVMERFIAHRSHNGAVLCIDTCGRYLATGGGDDRIVIIDLKLNKDVQEINRHQGSIHTVLFTNDGSHLLSGSEDGRLVATKVGSWITENVWKKPHTGKAILKVCLHESGKFALTLGKDGTLRGWDMLKGTQINTSNVKDLSTAGIILDNVELCPNGETFAMSGQKTVSVISFISGKTYDGLTVQSRVTSLCWLDNENLLIGMENGSIEWTNIKDSTHLNLPAVHKKRIKGMHHLNGFLGTISSTGDVALWSTSISNKKLSLICTTNETTRPTCIKLIDTSENRFKGEVSTVTTNLKNEIPQIAEKTKFISTIGKVIIETDENNQPFSLTGNDVDLPISEDDSDIDIRNTPTKKKQKRVKRMSSDEDVPLSLPSQSQKSKKRKVKVSPIKITKPIIVRSGNSEDDFEKKKEKGKKTRSQVSQKNETIIDGTPTSTKKIKSQEDRTSTPILKNKKEQPKETSVKSKKDFEKPIVNETLPIRTSHLIPTRKSKRKTQSL